MLILCLLSFGPTIEGIGAMESKYCYRGPLLYFLYTVNTLNTNKQQQTNNTTNIF